MTPDDFILRQLQAWRVPKTFHGLVLKDLPPGLLNAIPEKVLSAVVSGHLPGSFGLFGLPAGSDRAFAALLRRVLDAYVKAHPHVLEDEERPANRQVLWISWTALFGELVMADSWSDEFKATVSIFDRMEKVRALILTGLGDTPETPSKFEAAIKGLLTRRSSEGLRTYWESPLSLPELQARYGRTGIVSETTHV